MMVNFNNDANINVQLFHVNEANATTVYIKSKTRMYDPKLK